ncbi:MAG: DUF3501 family protein, partial [Pseudomonadota bacterium]|nr:DUF3501 family protein [Pseudomonadota bacterium]
MTATEHRITEADIVPPAEYAARRADLRKSLIAVKKNRRLEVGPFATFHFENYDTMWQQVHEMLHIEKGGAEQVQGELAAYNPLIPQGRELIATLMLEIEDVARRNRELYRLAGIEESVYIELADERIPGAPTEYDERTTPDGKTSSVHWLRFVFTPQQITRFRGGDVPAILGVAHPAYG